MISLDQIVLLDQKVASAIAKIVQLQAENATLRKSVEELTTSLAAKSNDLSALMQEQGKIETGILAALEKLGALDGGAAISQDGGAQSGSFSNEGAEPLGEALQSSEGEKAFDESSQSGGGEEAFDDGAQSGEGGAALFGGDGDALAGGEGANDGDSIDGSQQLAALSSGTQAGNSGEGQVSGGQAENTTFDIF